MVKMKKKISDIKILKELYPRDKINDSKVEEYTHYIGVLPAIVINQDNILIDGAHRLHAYKQSGQKEIECNIIKTKDDDDLFLKAVELNSKHGYQMTQKEKKKHVIKLYSKTLKGEAKTFDVERIKETFSIPDSTFSNWTKDLSDSLEGQLLEKILNLHLQCKTQEEIASLVGLKQNTIADKIKKIQSFLKELSENSDLEIPIIYSEIAKKWLELSEFKPQLYNIWNQQNYDGDNEHFGKFPFSFMENLIYYYTQPFDVVYDPFAGGGTTIDVCNKWLRKYYSSDLNPIETRSNIKKWDINKGLPKDLPKPKFVFLDPPYWLQAKEKYSNSKEDLGNMNLERFYDSIEKLVKELKKKMDSGYVAFVISPTQYPNKDHKFEDHIIKIINIFEKNKFEEHMRFVLPYSTQQYNGNQVDVAKKEKFPLSIIRDLVIFKLK